LTNDFQEVIILVYGKNFVGFADYYFLFADGIHFASATRHDIRRRLRRRICYFPLAPRPRKNTIYLNHSFRRLFCDTCPA